MKHHIFHHYDADGFASAAVITKYLTTEENVSRDDICTYVCKHGTPMDFTSVEKDDIIYILDYSFSQEADQKNLQNFDPDNIIWIDHHKSSDDIIANVPNAKIWADNGLVRTDNVYAGCMLCWFWINLEEDGDIDECYDSSPAWVKYVDDYDTWKHKLHMSKEFVAGVEHYGLYNVFLSTDSSYSCHISDNAPGITEKYINTGSLIMEFRAAMNKRIINGSAFEVEIKLPESDELIIALAVNSGGNSMLFGEWFEKFDAVIPFYFDGIHWNYSMFSRENGTDCSKVATYFGKKFGITGGGHYHAAGWASNHMMLTTDEEEILDVSRSKFKAMLDMQRGTNDENIR